MAGKATSLGKKTKQGARAKIKGKREEDPARATAANVASPIQRPDHDTGSKVGERIKEEIPEALAYFLEVYGRLGRG